MRLYLAGPMTGLPNFNYDMFHLYSELLRDRGYEVFNPAEAHDGDQGLPLWKYYAADLPEVASADAIAVLPGWQASTGARIEVLVAQKLDKKVYNAVVLSDPGSTEEQAEMTVQTEVTVSEDRDPIPGEAGYVHPEYGSEPEEPSVAEADEPAIDLKQVAAEHFVPYVENPERQRAVTGAVKDNRSKSRVDLIPAAPLIGAGKVLGYGALKYKPNNWRLGLRWSDTFASLLRHLLAFNEGEDIDEESGLPHIDHAMCQLLFLSDYYHTGTGEDDRWANSDREAAKA